MEEMVLTFFSSLGIERIDSFCLGLLSSVGRKAMPSRSVLRHLSHSWNTFPSAKEVSRIFDASGTYCEWGFICLINTQSWNIPYRVVFHQYIHWALRKSWLWSRIESFFALSWTQLLSLSSVFKMCWLGTTNNQVRAFSINSQPTGSMCFKTSSGELFFVPCTLNASPKLTSIPWRLPVSDPSR